MRVRLNHNSRKQDLLRAEVQLKVVTRSYEVLTEDGRRFKTIRVELRKTPERFDLDRSQSREQEKEPELEAAPQPAQRQKLSIHNRMIL